jgi:hypothetical protein
MYMALWSRNIRKCFQLFSCTVHYIARQGLLKDVRTSQQHFSVPTHVLHSPTICDVGMPFALTLKHTNTESSCCSCRVPVHVIYQFERTNPRGLQPAKINLLMPFFVLLNGSLWRYSVQVWSGRCSTAFQSFTP